MKRIFLILGLALILIQQVLAGPVDINKAKAFASQFIQVEEEGLRSAQNSNQGETPAYYIFNAKEKKGFVIVSGEDRLPLLIGYADDGQLEQNNLPIQLKELLKQYSQAVARLRKTANNDSFRSQKVFMHKPQVIVKPLTQSKWGQREPFNELCPEIRDGQRAVTGCVATALAQIMYYHKWPKKGKGSHSYVTKKNRKALSSDFSQNTYQWDMMKDEYKKDWVPHPTRPGWLTQKLIYTKEEGEAIGRLFADVGISVDMDYGIGESGAITQNAAASLTKYFDYSSRFLNRNEAEGNTFLSTIRRELDAKRPLVLSGSGSGGGHAWVIDGYDENDFLHCNWGWTGTSNGFFSLNLMSPSALGTGGGSGGYNSGQGILIAIPNKNGANSNTLKDLPLSFGDFAGLSLEMPYGKNKDSFFLFKLNSYFNYSDKAFNSKVGVGIYNTDKSFIAIVAEKNRYIKGSSGGIYSGGSSYIYEKLSNYSDGEYLLRPLFKPNGSNEWEFIKKGNTLTIEIKNGEVSVKSDSHQLRFQHAMPPREDVQAYTNSTGVSTIEVENLSSKYTETNLGIKLINLTTQKTYTKKIDIVRLPALGKAVLHPKYNLSDLNLPAGDYALSFELYFIQTVSGQKTNITKTIENPFGTYQIKVLNPNTLPKLICKGLAVEQAGKELETYHLSPELLKKGNFKFASSIQNKGTIAFNGKLVYRLKKLEDNSLTTLGETKNLSISAGQELDKEETAIDVNMPSLNLADGTYRIEVITNVQGEEINIWNADIEPYSFMTKGLQNVVIKKFKLTLAQAKAGGRLRFSSPISNDDFEHSFDAGTEVTLVSETAEDYELREVLLDGKNIYQEGKAIKLTLEKDTSLEPIYTKKLITLPQLKAQNGTLTYIGHKAGEKVAIGTIIKLNFEPNDGYELASLTHNGKDIKATKSFVLAKENSIVASFTKQLITLPQLTAQNGTLTYVGHKAGEKVAIGTTIKLNFEPNEGYELASLTHNGKDIKATKSFILAKENNIVASFTKQMITLPKLTAQNGTLTYVGHKAGVKVAIGATIKINFKPNEGYELASLTHNGKDIKATKSFILAKENNIVASFTKQMITLPKLTAQNGTLTYVGHKAEDKVAIGTTIKLNFEPNDGYELASLTHNGKDIKGTKSFVLTKENSIVASFTKQMITLPQLTAQNGTLTYIGHKAGEKVAIGTIIKLTAKGNNGYELASLTHNGKDIKATKSFVLTKGNTIVASFTKQLITLPQLTAQNGTLTYVRHKAGEKVAIGTTIKINFEPNEGYELASLTHNGKDIKATKSFVLAKENSIVASFTKQLITLPQLTAQNGTLTYVRHKAGEKVAIGTTIKLNFEPNDGYELASLSHNGKDIKATKSFVLAKENSIVASFTKQMITLPQLTAQNGTLTYVGHKAGEKIAIGTTIKLNFKPNDGYELASLTHNGKDIKATKSFVLSKENNFEISFSKITALKHFNNKQIQVYPNPARDYVQLEGFMPNEELYLITMTGKIVLQTKIAPDGTAKLNISNLARGFYLLRSNSHISKLQLR